MEEQVIFVTGIDTNIGKSYATAYLCRLLRLRGQRVITQKMIQTGNVGRSEDIELHRHLLSESWLPEDEEGLTAPIILSYPASPHLAARLDGMQIDLADLDRATQELLDIRGYDTVLLEGAGGLMVPITERYWTLDFIIDRGYSVAVTTSGRLGSINHTLLTLERCISSNIPVAYLIYNQYPSVDETIEGDTLKFLEGYLAERLPQTELIVLPQWPWA